MGALLDQAEQQTKQERQQAPPRSSWLLLPELLRNAVACAMAIGFAALAQRPGKGRSLLQQWQVQWRQGSEQRRFRRLKSQPSQEGSRKTPPTSTQIGGEGHGPGVRRPHPAQPTPIGWIQCKAGRLCLFVPGKSAFHGIAIVSGLVGGEAAG